MIREVRRPQAWGAWQGAPLTRPGAPAAPDDCPTPGLSELASCPYAQAAWKTGLRPGEGWPRGAGTQRSGGTRLRACGEVQEGQRQAGGRAGGTLGWAPSRHPSALHPRTSAPACPASRDRPALTASSLTRDGGLATSFIETHFKRVPQCSNSQKSGFQLKSHPSLIARAMMDRSRFNHPVLTFGC